MRLTDISRRQAFLTHLSISGVLFVALSYLIFFHWYPDFFFSQDGGIRAILILFMVDVVIGPGLTLLLFKPGKKGLGFDMTLVVLVQAIALAWGMHKIYEDRPIASVFYFGKFSCVAASVDEGIPQSVREAPQKLGFLASPDDPEEYLAFMRPAIAAGTSEIFFYADQIRPVDATNVERMRRYIIDRKELNKLSAAADATLMSYIEANEGYNETYGVYPMTCRFGRSLAVFDFSSQTITEYLPVEALDPIFRASPAAEPKPDDRVTPDADAAD